MSFIVAAHHSIALQGLVLAAGQSLRFKTGTPKLLEPLCGQAIVLYPMKLLAELSIPTTVVLAHAQDALRALIIKSLAPEQNVTFSIQENPHGTANAVACTQAFWNKEHILVINGDMPLVNAQLITRLYEKHLQDNAAASFVIAHNPDPTLETYDPVPAHNETLEFSHKNSTTPHEQCCIDAGVYIFKASLLRAWYASQPIRHDLYCTDIVQYAVQQGLPITHITAPFDHVREVNTTQDLWVAQQIKRAEIIRYWMHQGVLFSMPQTNHIDINVTIGAGTRIASGVHLTGTTKIGSDCTIKEFSIITDSNVGDRVTIHPHSVVTESEIGIGSNVGPFAHLRQTHLDEEVVVGNFVETARSMIGLGTKAKHLTYLGDAQVGSHVNIGAGTITCNHDSVNKHATTIADGAYIGSNTTLVAPVTVGQKAFTAAGSVITQPVASNALAIGRAHQVNKEGYAQKIREKAQLLHTQTKTGTHHQGLTPAPATKKTQSTETL